MDGEYQIQRIDLANRTVMESFSSALHGDGVDLDVDGAGTAIYSTTTLGEVVKIDLVAGPGYGMITTVASGLMDPRGIHVEATGTYAYVAEHGASRIACVELSSGTTTTVATLSSPPRVCDGNDAFSALSVALDSGDLVLVDIDPGSPGFGSVTTVLSGLIDPTGVAFSSSGFNVIVTDAGTGEVLTVDSDPASPGFGAAVTLAADAATRPGGVVVLPAPSFLILPCTDAPATGSAIAACAYAATGAAELGGFGATLSWDPSKLSFAGWTAGEPPFDSPVVNAANVASGTLSFSEAAASGAAGTSHLLCVELNVTGQHTVQTDALKMDLTITSAYDSALNSLIPGAVFADYPVDITSACMIGDPLEDSSTNSGDAVAILRHEVELSLPPSVRNLLEARCGDLNADGPTPPTPASPSRWR